MKGLGKRVELAAWRDSIAQDLEMEASGNVFYFDEHRGDLERSTSGSPLPESHDIEGYSIGDIEDDPDQACLMRNYPWWKKL